MKNYYSQKLAAERLKRCYEIAPPRIKQYLQAELDYVLTKIKSGDVVLELGCGYGRIISALTKSAKKVIGIDTSIESLRMAKWNSKDRSLCLVAAMNAVKLAFSDRIFDAVICIQNGISAFHVDSKILIKEALRVTKRGGIVMFSSYSRRFWRQRLNWFELQAEAGLLGDIDYEKTGNGKIVCKDGFTACTIDKTEFIRLTRGINASTKIHEIDYSSIFCDIIPY